MYRGYVKLWRKVGDSKMYRSKNLWALWTYLLLNATHKKRKVFAGLKIVELLPGQYITGRKALALELGVSPQSIRTCLNNLSTMGNITIKSTNKYSIITIVNWDTYQSDEEKSTNKTANDQPTTNQQLTTKQECKKVKKVKKEKKTPYRVPDLESIEVDSKLKIKEELDKITKFLYDTKIFLKAPMFVNTMRKQEKNDRAVLHTLMRCRLKATREKFKDDKAVWAYCTKIINVEDGNYNEKDFAKTS